MRIDSEPMPLPDPSRMSESAVFAELDDWSRRFPDLVLTCGPLRGILRRQPRSAFYDGGEAVRLTIRNENHLLELVRRQAPK